MNEVEPLMWMVLLAEPGNHFRKGDIILGLSTKGSIKEEELEALRGVVAGSSNLHIRFFSHKAWYVAAMLLLILNSFLVTRFGRALRRLWNAADHCGPAAFRELSIMDFRAELKTRVPSGSGFINLEALRSVLAACGLRLTRFRFNCVVKLLFELEGVTLAHSQVVRLVVMAQNEGHVDSISVCQHQPHSWLRSSVFSRDNFGQPNGFSQYQSNYNLFDLTKQLPASAQRLVRPSLIVNRSSPGTAIFVASDGFKHPIDGIVRAPVLLGKASNIKNLQHHASCTIFPSAPGYRPKRAMPRVASPALPLTSSIHLHQPEKPASLFDGGRAHFVRSTMADGSLFQVGENVEFWRVLVHLSILAFCLVLFEKALHRMEHKFPASDKYQHMLKKVYRELMVLGLISLGLKILKENPDIDSYSKPMLAFQVADLTIFFLALALILQSTAVFLLLRNQNDRADRAELMRTVDLVELVNSTENAKDAMPSFVRTLLCCGRESKKKTYVKKLVELRLLRRLFLRRFGFPQLFPFAKYLSRAQANQISHMIEVEPSMWVVLLAVAWGICGLLKLLEALDADMPERQELVEAFMIVAWILLLLHLMVFLYFRSCVHYLLRLAAINDDKTILTANLQAIAEEEAKAWQNEEADKALEIMSSIQEQHEEFEYERVRRKKKLARQDGGHLGAALCGLSSDHSNNLKGCESISGVAPGSPNIDIQFFSYKAWHVSVILLLVLNGLRDTTGALGAAPAGAQRAVLPATHFLRLRHRQQHASHRFADAQQRGGDF
ncbi:hypothetical protein ON010_g10788 [Phytophthora cinnamomi]|nr:hypothetical protein ON010_g10788 [Phytophthora cinnamomi]